MPKQAIIGLIGGMSWESSAEYYRIINREVRRRLGGVHSARTLMWSVDFGEIERLQHRGDWESLTEEMKDGARRLERGGADFILICTNTMHKMAEAVASAIAIPLLHIADPTAEKLDPLESIRLACSVLHSPWNKTSIRGACQRNMTLKCSFPKQKTGRSFTGSSTKNWLQAK